MLVATLHSLLLLRQILSGATHAAVLTEPEVARPHRFEHNFVKQTQVLSIRMIRILWLCAASLFLNACATSDSNHIIDINDFSSAMVGEHVRFFQESDKRITLAEAIERFTQSDVRQGHSQSIALGIGTSPAWLSFTVHNPSDMAKTMRLAIDTPWLDYIDTYMMHEGEMIAHIRGGDHLPFPKRPMAYRVYAFERPFPPGLTQVYIRAETLGPMAIPIVLSTPSAATANDISTGYQYGLLYGIMFALALYNFVLFVIIRHREFGLYSLYLMGFILNSLSYTGQLHVLITEDFGVHFQDWLDNFLMITYSVAGLHFARVLLKTHTYAPNLDRITKGITIVIPIGILIGYLADELVFSLILAFILNSGFATLFIAMGIAARRAHVPSANLFIVSSVTAAVCIGISTMAVAGIVPYNEYTFKAIEVGMAFEAIMLSVILAKIFRMTQRELLVAEKIARTDPLTEINNRRGFEAIATSHFQSAIESGHDVSVALIDIDRFKTINDQHGHSVGDEVLKKVAQALARSARKSDLVARWGGEEFIMLLPNTNQSEGRIHAERLRQSLENLSVLVSGQHVKFTASIGLAGTENQNCGKIPAEQLCLETMIRLADSALYKAKESGRNKVMDVYPEAASA